MKRSEYQKLRKTALKRIARLEAAGLGSRIRQSYQGGRAFPAASTLTADEFKKASRKLKQFLAAKTSTVSGARKVEKKPVLPKAPKRRTKAEMEYMRDRSRALKRIRRLEETGLYTNLPRKYGYGKAFPPISDIKTPEDLLIAKRKLESFLSAESSTVAGLKRATARTRALLESIGMEVTPKDVNLFGEFMKAARLATKDTMFDSERAVESFKLAKEKKLDPFLIADSFDKWQEKNIEKQISRRKKGIDNQMLMELIDG